MSLKIWDNPALSYLDIVSSLGAIAATFINIEATYKV